MKIAALTRSETTCFTKGYTLIAVNADRSSEATYCLALVIYQPHLPPLEGTSREAK